MSSGIIIRRRAILLIAATDSAFYDTLPAGYKAMVDAIDGAPPANCTVHDLETLCKVLKVGVHC